MTKNGGRKCSECGGQLTTVRKDYRFRESGLDNVILKGIEVSTCKDCGEEYVRIPRPSDLMRTISLALISKPSELTGPEVRFLRKQLQLTAETFAGLVGVDSSTMSRWETGDQSIGTQSDRLIRMIVMSKGTGLKETAEQILANFATMRGRASKVRTVTIAPDTGVFEYEMAA